MICLARWFSIVLPDDVAAELGRVDDVSAYVAQAIRMRRCRREAVRGVLARAGYQVSDDGVRCMRERVRETERRRGGLGNGRNDDGDGGSDEGRRTYNEIS